MIKKEKSVTKRDENVSDVAAGWYSRDDMKTVLKWTQKLGLLEWLASTNSGKRSRAQSRYACWISPIWSGGQDRFHGHWRFGTARTCRYGGGDEFYVQTRETDNHRQQQRREEVIRETQTQDCCCLGFHIACQAAETSQLTGVDEGRLSTLQSTRAAAATQVITATSEASRSKTYV